MKTTNEGVFINFYHKSLYEYFLESVKNVEYHKLEMERSEAAMYMCGDCISGEGIVQVEGKIK